MKFFTYCLLILVTRSAHAAMLPDFREGIMTVESNVSYFNTKENFREDGERNELYDGQSYTNTSVVFAGSYNFPWSVTGTAGGQYSYAKSVGYTEDRTNGEFNELFLRGRKMVQFGNFRLVPETDLTFALNSIDELQDEVVTGEGTNRYLLGSHAIYAFSKLRLFGFLGYMVRGDGRSNLMPWNAGIGYRARPIWFEGEIGGSKSISDDEYTDTPWQREVLNDAVNGGSFRYYSVNPDVVELRVGAKYLFSGGVTLAGRVAHTVSGTNTAYGQTYTLGMSWATDLLSPTNTSSAKNIKKNSAKKGDDLDKIFKEELEEYDETLYDSEE